jgi:hypothetical protein
MKFPRFLVLLLFLLLTGLPVGAQTTNEPLILWIAGDLWTVTDTTTAPTALTQVGTISVPALAPTGDRIAGKAAATVGLEALDRLGGVAPIAEFDLPADIFVLDVATGVAANIAGQPEDASLFVEGVPDNATVRSTPVWSPDGSRLAWTYLPFGGTTASLAVYDFAAAGSLPFIAAIAAPVVRGTAPDLRWSEWGFAIRAYAESSTEQTFLFYTPDGSDPNVQPTAIATVQPGEDEEILDFEWVRVGENWRLGVLFNNARWVLIDPATGVAEDPASPPVLVSLTASDSLRLRFGFSEDVGLFWEALDPLNPAAASVAFPGTRVTLSPNGREIAFIGYPTFGAAATVSGETIREIPGTGSGGLLAGAALWGPLIWRLE